MGTVTLCGPPVAGRASVIAVGRLVNSFDQVARFLEFDRQKECGRGVDAPDFATANIGAAHIDVVYPKVQTGGVRFAVQEIQVLLTHKNPVCVRGFGPFALSLSVMVTVAFG